MSTFQGQGITSIRGEQLIYQNVNFILKSGEVLKITGSNGSGKTTLLRQIAGLLPLTAGQILWDDKSWDYLNLSYLGHKIPIKLSLSLVENLRFWAQLWGSSPESCTEALIHFGLEAYANLPAELLSFGLRKRLHLCQLLLQRSEIWLLDEPLVGLDACGHTQLVQAIKRHTAQGGICLVATHQSLSIDKYQLLNLDTPEQASRQCA